MPINNRAVRRPAKKTMLKFFQLMVLIIFPAVIVFAQKRLHTAALQRQEILLATTALKTPATKSSHVSNKKLAASANALLCTTPVVSGPGGLPLGFSNILSADQAGTLSTSDASKVSLTTPNATDILMKGEAVGSAIITFTSTCDGSQITRTITVSAPTVNPGGVPGALVWLRADSITNGSAATWKDVSPSQYSFAGVSDQANIVTHTRRNGTATSSNVPTYIASAINFNPVVNYNGPDALHRFGTLASPVTGPLLSNTTSFVAGASPANTISRSDAPVFAGNNSWAALNKATDRLFISATYDGQANYNGTVNLFYYSNTIDYTGDWLFTNSNATNPFNSGYSAYAVPFVGATYSIPYILAQSNPSIASGPTNYTISRSGSALEIPDFANDESYLSADAPANKINYYSLGNTPSSVFSTPNILSLVLPRQARQCQPTSPRG